LLASQNAFHEIGLGVRATVKGSLVEVGSAAIGGSEVVMPIPLQRCMEDLLNRGSTPLVVYRDSSPVGLLSVSDRVRPIAARAVEEFKKLGLNRLAILSGDHEKSVRRVADLVGITEVYSKLKPQDKLEIIKKYQEKELPVMFVGDGINDAPALASANVGVAMGVAGTDVALETALAHDDVSKLPWLIRLGQRMLTIIKLNIAFGLVFNTAAVLTGGLGLLTPIMAAIVHNIGSVLVVISSASLAFFPEKQSIPS